MADPTGEADKGALRLDFDRRLLLQFRGTTITSDGGLLAYRELEDTFRLTDAGADRLADARTGKNGRHRLAGLLRRPAARNGPTAMAFCSYWARFAVAQAAHRYDPGFETAGNLANVGGHGFVATWFLCTLLATLFLPITASAGDQENSTGKLADGGLTNPLIFDSNVNHEHLQEADVDSSFVAARAEPRKTETWPPTRGNDDTAPN